MAIKESDKQICLDKISHSVRASQAILQYGVGAMVDFPSQTLMTAAPEYWESHVIRIHDERLEKALHVDYFGLPAGGEDPRGQEGIAYVRFPEWYFCPKCRRFQTISAWKKEYQKNATAKQIENDPEMVKHLMCPTCKQALVVSRIITACEHGHIDDFPWEKWVHCKNLNGGSKNICSSPKLVFKTSPSATEGLEGLSVTCQTCNARATLKGAFDPKVFENIDKRNNFKYDFRCEGRHPWKRIKESCDKYPKVLQRGSSSVYFPITASSLVIPPYSSILTKKVEDSQSYEKSRSTLAMTKQTQGIPKEVLLKIINNIIDDAAGKISLEISAPKDQIIPILKRKWLSPTDSTPISTDGIKYRAEEFEALSGEVSIKNDGEFIREFTDINDYDLYGISKITLIHSVREVQALIGYSRINPVDQEEIDTNSNRGVRIKERKTNWYPAYQVRGEGIFIEFSEEAIDDWKLANPCVINRANILNEAYKQSYIGKNKNRIITAKFILLHTISHLLIKQLSFACGYSIASLKERIYCGDKSEGKQMAGILIYTANGDSEGTLGGLVRQGRADVFPAVFKKAIETAVTCSNDPVCSLSMGQGRESLNLSACYACCLVPETSCEEYNILLDRAMIVGTYENRLMGFYSKQLADETLWKLPNPTSLPKDNTEHSQTKKQFLMFENGTDLSELDYAEIFSSLCEWSDDDNEISLLKKLAEASHRLIGVVKPLKDCTFKITGSEESYQCDLYWADSKVALFTAEKDVDYNTASETGVICFYTGDKECSVDSIVDALLQKR